MIHKGIEYDLIATDRPDVWQWRFQIGDKLKTGKTQTRLPYLAARRVQLKIDATLKAMEASSGMARSRPLKIIDSRVEDRKSAG